MKETSLSYAALTSASGGSAAPIAAEAMHVHMVSKVQAKPHSRCMQHAKAPMCHPIAAMSQISQTVATQAQLNSRPGTALTLDLFAALLREGVHEGMATALVPGGPMGDACARSFRVVAFGWHAWVHDRVRARHAAKALWSFGPHMKSSTGQLAAFIFSYTFWIEAAQEQVSIPVCRNA